ncbi:gastric triacylglycerol lipase-like [Ixodes scapularis]|uniref:gastric triacylglycerol lipase-like n=1 Tax=Ixodes scapularis TaxID=6945 RepID=UPI001A9DFF35|nr:gastric triacylglycerol lipase-like [Ixodes scapularis]
MSPPWHLGGFVLIATAACGLSTPLLRSKGLQEPLYTGNDPDACKDIEHLVVSKGYPFERHHVTTDDGYVLEMHRLPGGRRPCTEPCHREPVLLMTGLGTDSASFVADFPDQSLGFLLADIGYDVWLANTRGNTFGKQHVNLSVKSKRFWDFSFHEHGIYDAPAQIDYVLKERQLSCLLYVGISQGTLMFFVMMSERPEYNAKVKAFVALAPFRKFNKSPLTIVKALPVTERLLRLAGYANLDKLTSHSVLNAYTAKGVCGLSVQSVCTALADKIMNFGSKYANRSRMPVYLCKLPAGTSMKNLQHFLQLMISKKSQKFDYGPEKNAEIYGQAEPPLYSLDTMTTDVGAFWSLGDKLVFPDTVAQLIEDLGPRVKKNVYIDDPDYTHINFVNALINPEVLFPDLLEFLARYLGRPCERGLEPHMNEE